MNLSIFGDELPLCVYVKLPSLFRLNAFGPLVIAIVGEVTIPDSPVVPAGIGSLASMPGARILIVPPTPTTNVSATACGTELLIWIAITSLLSQPPPSVTLYSKFTFKGSEPVMKEGAV